MTFLPRATTRNGHLPYRLGIGLIWLGLCALYPIIAEAQPQPIQKPQSGDCATYLTSTERSDPQALTLHGVNCFEADEFAWALTYYTQAYALSEDPFLYGGIGRSLQELGLYGPAMAYYQRFLQEGDAQSGAERIRSRVEELETLNQEQARSISLQSAPSGATVYIILDNGQWHPLGSTPMELTVREGNYEFAFDDQGYRPHRISTDTTDHDEPAVTAHLISEQSGLGLSQRHQRRTGIWTSLIGLGIGAAGATMLVLSAQNHSTARSLESGDFNSPSDYDERLRSHLDTAHTQQTWGTVASAVGATTLLIGSVMYLRSSPSPSPSPQELDTDSEARSLQIEPAIGTTHLGLRLRF